MSSQQRGLCFLNRFRSSFREYRQQRLEKIRSISETAAQSEGISARRQKQLGKGVVIRVE